MRLLLEFWFRDLAGSKIKKYLAYIAAMISLKIVSSLVVIKIKIKSTALIF